MPAITWGLGCPDPKPQKPIYIKPQPTIYMYDPLELLEGIIEAEENGTDTVYILNPGKGNGHTGIDLWYAKQVFIQYYDIYTDMGMFEENWVLTTLGRVLLLNWQQRPSIKILKK